MAEQQGEQVESSLCDQLQITVEELQTRLAFLSFGEQDGRNLAEILEVIASHVDEIIGEFYDHLLQFEELQRILSDRALVERLKGSQRRYLLSLGQLGDDIEYAGGAASNRTHARTSRAEAEVVLGRVPQAFWVNHAAARGSIFGGCEQAVIIGSHAEQGAQAR